MLDGGLFRYFFRYPTMLVGKYGVFWHRPMAAYLSHETDKAQLLDVRLPGYFTAYDAKQPDLAHPIELYPRLLERPVYLSALRHLDERRDHYRHQTALNILTILDMSALWHEPRLPRSFARQTAAYGEGGTRAHLVGHRARASDAADRRTTLGAGDRTTDGGNRSTLAPGDHLRHDGDASFEEAYWNDIITLAHGKFVNKVNSDVVQDAPTKKRVKHPHRDLHALGDYLIERHQAAIATAGMEGKAFVGELPFKWETDFDFSQYGGWVRNQTGEEYERNILMRDSRQASR